MDDGVDLPISFLFFFFGRGDILPAHFEIPMAEHTRCDRKGQHGISFQPISNGEQGKANPLHCWVSIASVHSVFLFNTIFPPCVLSSSHRHHSPPPPNLSIFTSRKPCPACSTPLQNLVSNEHIHGGSHPHLFSALTQVLPYAACPRNARLQVYVS